MKGPRRHVMLVVLLITCTLCLRFSFLHLMNSEFIFSLIFVFVFSDHFHLFILFHSLNFFYYLIKQKMNRNNNNDSLDEVEEDEFLEEFEIGDGETEPQDDE